MDIFSIQKIIVILINILSIFFIFWVYFSNPKAKVNKSFSLMTFFSVLWISFSYLANTASSSPNALFWTKFAEGSVLLLVLGLYIFSTHFPTTVKKPIISKIILAILILPFVPLVFLTDLITKGMVHIKGWGFSPAPGQLWYLFHIVIFFVIVLVLYHLFSKYKIISKEERLKIQYCWMGILIFLVINIIFNIIFPFYYKDYRFIQIGTSSIIFFLGFTAFAIVKRELFGIKVILTQALVGVIAVLLLTQAITAENWLEFAWKFILFLLFLVFGYLLIKSVLNEIKRREEIERIDKAKSEFISIASHQLRTPLTAIKGYISMIIEGTYGKLAERAQKPMENVFQSNERLIRLVNDLLNLSRLDAGKIQFEPTLTSLEKMVSGIIEELKINVEKKGLYIKIVKPKKPMPEIMVDEDKLRQVILNIIDNAIKYTKEGGITVKLNKLDDLEEIRISDSGAGMDRKELESLFQMFSRATAGTQLHTEGAGIGLYVARQFIEMHGGKIWAESAGKGKGSIFIIRLPIHLDKKLLKTRVQPIPEKSKHFI